MQPYSLLCPYHGRLWVGSSNPFRLNPLATRHAVRRKPRRLLRMQMARLCGLGAPLERMLHQTRRGGELRGLRAVIGGGVG